MGDDRSLLDAQRIPYARSHAPKKSKSRISYFCFAHPRTLFHLTRTRLRAGPRVSLEWGSVRTNGMLGRYSSEIKTGCANQRPSGSVRGALSNECPYRDHQLIPTLSARRLVRQQVQIQRRSDGRTVGLQGHTGKTGVAAIKCCVVNPSAQIFVMP